MSNNLLNPKNQELENRKTVNFQKADLSENTNKTFQHALNHFQKW